jgi:hypothetical protein
MAYTAMGQQGLSTGFATGFAKGLSPKPKPQEPSPDWLVWLDKNKWLVALVAGGGLVLWLRRGRRRRR